MVEHIEGELQAGDERFAIVVSRYNESVTRRLCDGAVETLKHHGVADEHITVVWVPGAFEIPLIAHQLAHSQKYAAVCCLGAVVQGDTDHHDYINHQVAYGVREASITNNIPVLFGVLTCGSMQLAVDRAGGKSGNKGSEAALAAVEMVNLLKKLRDNGTPF